MTTVARAEVLTSDDYRRILAVLEVVEGASTLGDFSRLSVEAFAEHLGWHDLWLDTELAGHGYISVRPRNSGDFGRRDEAILFALRPHLSHLLRSILGAPDYHPVSSGLSPREAEVAGLVALGRSNREIGRHLGIGEDTVKKHLWRAMHKLGVANRTQLAVRIRAAGDFGNRVGESRDRAGQR